MRHSTALRATYREYPAYPFHIRRPSRSNGRGKPVSREFFRRLSSVPGAKQTRFAFLSVLAASSLAYGVGA